MEKHKILCYSSHRNRQHSKACGSGNWARSYMKKEPFSQKGGDFMMKRAWNHYWLLCEISVCLLLLGILMTAPGGFMISRGGDGGIYLISGLVLLAAGFLGFVVALVMNRQREERCMKGKTVPVRFVRTVWDLKSRSSGIRNPDLVNGKASAGNARVIVDASMSQDGMAVLGGGKKIWLGEYCADENGVRTYYYTEPLVKNMQLPEKAVAHVNVSNRQEYMLVW